MSSPVTLQAAKALSKKLEGFGVSAKTIGIKNNDWLAKVETGLGTLHIYTNAKGKVTIHSHHICDQKSREKLERLLEKINSQATIKPIDATTWVAYTDGSAQGGQCGWAAVVFDPSGKKHQENSGNLGPQSNGQIAGEIESAICVIRDAIAKRRKSLLIRHDYEGVGHWGRGTWKNSDADASRLKAWCRYAREKGVSVQFDWTRGHNGDAGNERADVLAGKATSFPKSPRIENPPRSRQETRDEMQQEMLL